jgi:hypothetical protein
MTDPAFGQRVLEERQRLAEDDPEGEGLAVEPLPPVWSLVPDIDADPVASELLPPTEDEPRVTLERTGPSYFVTARPLGARFVFRDVRTDRDLTADVTINWDGRHLFRTTVTLSLQGRDKIAKTAAELARGKGDAWRRATFAAVEAVLAAEERLGSPIDLRRADLTLPSGGLHVARPFWPVGSVVLVAPGDSGKSTIARAVAVSMASGAPVIPGIDPVGDPRPVLYVAGEDPVPYWHSRSVEAICRGAGIDRRTMAHPIELFDARGRPLHRIARAIAERAADFGAVILDSQQALLAQLDGSGGIRDRDSLFWHSLDQLDRPTLVIAHPNRADSRDWQRADGRIAGSEVNRDRARMAWRATFRDELAVAGTSYRRYTLENVKNNHGAKEPALAFAAAWEFGDPGVLRFHASEAVTEGPKLGAELSAALEQYKAGHTTPGPLAEALGITYNTAKSRLRLLRERNLLDGSDEAV